MCSNLCFESMFNQISSIGVTRSDSITKFIIFLKFILEIKSQRETGAMSMWEITQNMSLLKLENLQLL